MMRVVSCVVALHNLWLVALAALVCLAGGWVGLRLYRLGRSRSGRQRLGWTFLAGVAIGASVWCTHFIAMLAYEVAAPVRFEPVLTMISLLVAIGGASVAFLLANRTDRDYVLAGGAVLGLAISAMHYSGMFAYRVDGFVHWDFAYVVASVLLAVLLGAGAIWASAAQRNVFSLAFFASAVVALHFTGMAAISVDPYFSGVVAEDPAVIAAIAVAVAGVALLIVGTGVASYIIDADVSEQNVESLRQMALNDTLTGLPNRRSFSDHIAHELDRAEMSGDKIAIIGIDLDKFKEINDIRGHEAGDQVLKVIGWRLATLLRDGEFVARIGGDEFSAVKRFVDQRDLMDFVTRLEAELSSVIRIDEIDVICGGSIGVSIYPQDGSSAARLIGNADLAMYRAKADITRSVCFYEAEMDEQARARRELVADLRRAIDDQELELHYQVQESVAERGRVVGYEVLLRWRHPVRGFVPPDEFIPLAEEAGLILPIGEWVLREACRQAAGWPKNDKIAVNLSAIQLTHCDMPRLVHEVLLETGLSASRLELEITESSIIHDKVRSLHALRKIKALGVTIAIDDFGTGYSSLETLRSFPFDRIKLDRSFMSEVEHSPQARAIVRAVLALGKSLEISILAEGVETEEQLDLLRREGCTEAQGFLLGRPMPRGQAAHRFPEARPVRAVGRS
jgi:diguanylate cyclase (GGDEF)-like protein